MSRGAQHHHHVMLAKLRVCIFVLLLFFDDTDPYIPRCLNNLSEATSPQTTGNKAVRFHPRPHALRQRQVGPQQVCASRGRLRHPHGAGDSESSRRVPTGRHSPPCPRAPVPPCASLVVAVDDPRIRHLFGICSGHERGSAVGKSGCGNTRLGGLSEDRFLMNGLGCCLWTANSNHWRLRTARTAHRSRMRWSHRCARRAIVLRDFPLAILRRLGNQILTRRQSSASAPKAEPPFSPKSRTRQLTRTFTVPSHGRSHGPSFVFVSRAAVGILHTGSAAGALAPALFRVGARQTPLRRRHGLS